MQSRASWTASSSRRSRKGSRAPPGRLSRRRGSNAVDAIVVASAARRGDVVYTSDVAGLREIARYFPDVRILGV
jgi:hypothetical protein